MDSHNEDETTKKQQLLQTEILDRNLDREKFVNFCLQKKENGDDLNLWSVEELTKIVSEFVQQETQLQNKPSNKDDEMNVENVQKMEEYNADDKQFKEIEIRCRKLEKSVLNGKKIVINLSNPKCIDSGMFGQTYVLYEVTTPELSVTVQRRYSDFDNLRKLLFKLYPGYNIPPLPNKKMGTRRFDVDFIMKRMKFLELFINAVCENESFKASEILVAFLTYSDRGKFDQKMKEYASYQPSTYLEEFKTLDEKVVISHDEGNEKYFTNITKYFRLQTQIMDKLNFNLKQFYNNMSLAADNIGDAAKNFEILHILNSRVLMKPTITKTYDELSFFLKEWQKIMIKQCELAKTHFKDFFKYINLEGQSYSELIAHREELKQKYLSELGKLNSKKEKIFSAGNINAFELDPSNNTIDQSRIVRDKNYAFEHMCYKENQSLKLLYNQLGYVNKMNIHELKKMIRKYVQKFLKNLETFDENFYPTINDVRFYIFFI